MDTRVCAECGSKIAGRLDKKFCSDGCRNVFNNRNNSDANNLVRNINNALRRNRRILEGLLAGKPDGKVRVNINKLASAGFDFEYYTNIYTTKTGAKYFFCYEYGYLRLDDDLFMVVKREARD
jgi:predicted nucleic acid-binding Zn ribbon protein